MSLPKEEPSRIIQSGIKPISKGGYQNPLSSSSIGEKTSTSPFTLAHSTYFPRPQAQSVYPTTSYTSKLPLSQSQFVRGSVYTSQMPFSYLYDTATYPHVPLQLPQQLTLIPQDQGLQPTSWYKAVCSMIDREYGKYSFLSLFPARLVRRKLKFGTPDLPFDLTSSSLAPIRPMFEYSLLYSKSLIIFHFKEIWAASNLGIKWF